MSLFHINTCSLSKNIEEHEYLLDKTKIDFDVIGITESRIKKNKSPVNRVNLKDCSYEPCPTESSSSGSTLWYISNNLSYKPRSDLWCICRSTELESTIIEISNPKKTNFIVSCI